MPSYYQDLRNIKTTLKGISEYNYIAKIIRKKASPNTLDILDIGMGDGHFSIRLSQNLSRHSLNHTILGVDPDPTLADIQYPSNFSLHNIPFETYYSPLKRDIIFAIHSLYYFSSVKYFIERTIKMTRKGGRIFIVLLSDQCVLYKISKASHSDNQLNIFLTAEKAYSDIKSYLPELDLSITTLRGTVDLNKWLISPKLIRSAYRIFSRNSDYNNMVDEKNLSAFIDSVMCCKNEKKRTVGILEIKK